MILTKRQYINKGRSELYPMILVDFLIDNYRKIFKKKSFGEPNNQQTKILILANGHLGDALQISYLFPLLKKKFPECQITLVSGDWCNPVWKHNSLIYRVLELNDWRINRKNISYIQKIQEFLKNMKNLIKELKNETFDYAVDVRYSNQQFLFLLPFIKIKKTIGYSTRGLGGLLDIEADIPPQPRHNMDWLLGLLKPIGIEEKTESIKPYFDIPDEYADLLEKKLKNLNIANDYIVILPESGAVEKMFDVSFWTKLIVEIQKKHPNIEILISGLTEYCDEIVSQTNSNKVHSLKKMLSIHEIGLLAKKSKGVFCLDSFPCHLSSIFTNVVTYFKIDHLLFLPINNYPIFVYHFQDPKDWKNMNRAGFHNEQILAFDDNLIQKTALLI